ncbi:hypothetical protein B0H14DRAFT_3509785 [Mycena olivaceomarginata]|nr:hypothetical protein B0H14DRAFT_3509785 [Mycena olivaceomarginata]
MPSDDNDAHSGSERDTPAPPRRVIDLELDDGDDDWEDLATLGTSTHRSRNPGHPRIPVNKRKRKLGGKNARASALKKRGSNISKMKRLGGDLDVLDKELDERAEKLAEKYSMKVKDVRRRMLATSTYKMPRKPSLYNAKISVIMADLNTDREEGSRLTIPEVKVIVRDDPSLLEGYTTEEEAQMLADLEAKRDRKCRGTRANNISANADIKRTMARLVEELNGMAQRANMVGFAMFSRGHLHDTSTPTTINILKKEPADVSALFELWAVNREKGTTGGNTLRAMQKECTDMILTGLMAVTRRTKIAMNYENYISSMVEGKNVGLVGWPQGVAFKHMSLQSALPPLKILRDALKAGTCRWKVLTPTERERILKNFEDMVEKGEAKVKPKKGAGTTRRKSSRTVTKSSSAKRKGNGLSEESSEEDESGGEQASRGSGITVRQKLLALVEDAVKKGEGKGKASSNARFTKKARAPHEDTSTRRKKKDATAKPKKTRAGARKPVLGTVTAHPPSKKRKKISAGNTDGEPPTKEKPKKASAEEDDSAPPAKRKKTSPREDEPAAPAVAKPRPKPRRLAKKAASPTVPVRSVSPTPRSPAASTSAASPKRAESASAAAHPLSPAPRSSAPRSPATSAAPASQATPGRPMVKGKRGGPPGQRP